MGLKTEAKEIAADGQGPLRPRLRRPGRQRRRGGPPDRQRDRLPRPDQGRRRRRRQGDARLPRGRRASLGRPPGGPQRGRGRLQEPSVYLEKYIDRPRHVEVQILADTHGNVVHSGSATARSSAGTRSSSRNRPPRPCPPKVRDASSCEAAVRLVKAAGYINAGTCEFLVDADNNFYFIEVNARIQVEHPVTELVTGIDLVKQQIRDRRRRAARRSSRTTSPRAATPSSAGSTPRTPTTTSAPRPGTITALRVPGGPGVRSTPTSRPATRVPPNYDSLVGKLIVHRPDRAEAIATMRRALDELVDRGDPDDDPAPPPDLPQPRLHRGPRRHHLGRAGPHARQAAPREA